MYNPFWYSMPFLPADIDEPPTIYSLLESIVNYGKDEKTKISDLAAQGRSTFFDFTYPLTDKISKEQFETMILNYYMMRRIGYETLTAFKLQLNVKLNMIMPKYNMMFDSVANWNLFTDGKTITRNITGSDTGSNQSSNSLTNSGTTGSTIQNATSSTSSSTINNATSNTTSGNRKRSDLPQNELTNLDDNKYISEYERTGETSNGTNNTTESGTVNGTNNTTESGTNSLTSNGTVNGSYSSSNTVNEVTTYTQNDLVKLYEEFQNNLNHIYQMIFNDLDSLFYSLI